MNAVFAKWFKTYLKREIFSTWKLQNSRLNRFSAQPICDISIPRHSIIIVQLILISLMILNLIILILFKKYICTRRELKWKERKNEGSGSRTSQEIDEGRETKNSLNWFFIS